MSFIHCPTDPNLKADFCADLSRLGDGFVGPWVILGNYNTVWDQREKFGGRMVGSSSTPALYQLVLKFGFVDLGFIGPAFTWCNGWQGSRRIKERLDKGFLNLAWSELFPRALVHHLPRTTSDHCPIMLSTQGSIFRGQKPFRFEQFWLKEESCGKVIKHVWLNRVVGSLAFQLC